MGKNIEGGSGASGQFVLASDGEQAHAADEGGVGLLHRFDVAIESSGGGPCGKNGSVDAARFEQQAVVIRKAVKLEFDDARESIGYAELDLRQGKAQGDMAFLGKENALRAQVIKRGDHEQGIAGRVLMDEAGEAGGQCVSNQLAAEIFSDGLFGQGTEAEPFAAAAGEEILLEEAQRVFGIDVGWPEAAEQHEPGAPTAAGEGRDEVESRRISPVNVFEDEEQSIGLAEGLERLADFPERWRRSSVRAEPAGRGGCEERAGLLVFHVAEAVEGFADGVEGFFSAEAFERLPTCDA